MRAAVLQEHEEVRYTVHEPGAGPDSAAPLVVDTRWAGDGSVSDVRVVVGPENMPLSIEVGGARYLLKEGRLVEQACGASVCS